MEIRAALRLPRGELGGLIRGMLADFVVLDTDPFDAGVDLLLTSSTGLTLVGGQGKFRAWLLVSVLRIRLSAVLPAQRMVHPGE